MKHETQRDREAEARILQAAFPDRVSHKLPMRYHIDYLLDPKTRTRRDKNHQERTIQVSPPTWVECKMRNCEWGTYDHYLISVAKLEAGIRLARVSSGFFYIATGWTDNKVALAHIESNFPELHYRIIFAGRIDRNNEEDKEPCFMIPNASFKLINADLSS